MTQENNAHGAPRGARHILSALVCAWAMATLARAADDPNLNAGDILRTVREVQASQTERHLAGQLRTSTGQIYPFILNCGNGLIRYQFQPPAPADTFQVRLSEENSQMQASGPGIGSEKLTPVNFDKKVLNTCLTYEDLALRFLYWSRAQIVDQETIKTRPSWKLRLDAPTRHSEYSSVNLWIDKESGAMLKAEGYDANGKLIKRFDVVSAQKIDGAWYLKQMRVECIDPATDGHVTSRTYLEIKGPAK